MVHVGLDAAWSNAVDSDLLIAGINGHATDEGLDGALGAGVDCVLWDALGLASDRAHQDDAAANAKVLVGLAGDEELATGVDAEDAVEFLLAHVLEVAERDDAGIGADNVELAKVLNGLIEHLDRLLDVADVGLDRNSVAAVRLDLVDDLVRCLRGVRVVEYDLCTAAGKLGGHCGSKATAGARDEGDLAIKAGGLDSLRSHCCCLCAGGIGEDGFVCQKRTGLEAMGNRMCNTGEEIKMFGK